jgi:transposase
MEFTFFIGIDVSKNELDFAVRQGNGLLFHKEIKNSSAAILGFIKELDKIDGFSIGKAVFCMEHTGVYNNYLLGCLGKIEANICLESAILIKNSLGKLRGKNDKIDSIRISEFAYEKREKLRLWKPKRNIVQRLSHLNTTRSRLVSVKKMLSVPIKELNPFLQKAVTLKQERMAYKDTLKSIDADLKRIDKAMKDIIDADPELKRLFSLITSVVGIGIVTATSIVIATNEFKDIKDPKKFACYAGVAPFTDESGLLAKRSRVSHMANKKVKTLLHLSSMVAIQYNDDLKNFYKRKVEEDHKNKMSVLNAVRNKLIHRIFTCVNQNRKYQQHYRRPAA